MTTLVTLVAFWGLFGLTLSNRARFAQVLARKRRDWILDITGLLAQGVLVPLVLTVPLLSVYTFLWPSLHGSVHLPAVAAFAAPIVGVDYLYYWNHRLLHTPALWPWHRVHHTAEHMDVLVTSRNTLWTNLLMVHVWATSVALFLLHDPAPYLWGAALTACLDLARHAPITLARWPRLEFALGLVLVLPRDHAFHHADNPRHGNFGANLVLWDRLHGTYLGAGDPPSRLGVGNQWSTARSLLWPFGGEPPAHAMRHCAIPSGPAGFHVQVRRAADE